MAVPPSPPCGSGCAALWAATAVLTGYLVVGRLRLWTRPSAFWLGRPPARWPLRTAALLCGVCPWLVWRDPSPCCTPDGGAVDGGAAGHFGGCGGRDVWPAFFFAFLLCIVFFSCWRPRWPCGGQPLAGACARSPYIRHPAGGTPPRGAPVRAVVRCVGGVGFGGSAGGEGAARVCVVTRPGRPRRVFGPLTLGPRGGLGAAASC